MAEAMTVKLDGLEECLKLMELAGESAVTALQEAMMEGAEPIRVEAEQNAPGEGIVKEIEKKKRGEVTVGVGPDKKHWFYRFFETGTTPHEIDPRRTRALWLMGLPGYVFAARVEVSGMAARPFLRPAFDGKVEEAKRRFGDAIWKRISQVLGNKEG